MLAHCAVEARRVRRGWRGAALHTAASPLRPRVARSPLSPRTAPPIPTLNVQATIAPVTVNCKTQIWRRGGQGAGAVGGASARGGMGIPRGGEATGVQVAVGTCPDGAHATAPTVSPRADARVDSMAPPSRTTIAQVWRGPPRGASALSMGTQLANEQRTQHRTLRLAHLSPDVGPGALV